MSASALALHGVARHFGRRAVLRDLDLQLGPGERVALTGPNGSGKTTLLRVAATVLRPTAGSLQVAGVDGHRDAARNALAYVAQDAPVYAELTPVEHLDWWSRLHGVRPSAEQAMRAAIDAGLARHAHRPAAHLSRGQRQRLALALAFASGAPLLLLDEPFTALDAEAAGWLEQRLAAYDGAVLAALHDAERAGRLFHRTVRLEGGHLA